MLQEMMMGHDIYLHEILLDSICIKADFERENRTITFNGLPR